MTNGQKSYGGGDQGPDINVSYLKQNFHTSSQRYKRLQVDIFISVDICSKEVIKKQNKQTKNPCTSQLVVCIRRVDENLNVK